MCFFHHPMSQFYLYQSIQLKIKNRSTIVAYVSTNKQLTCFQPKRIYSSSLDAMTQALWSHVSINSNRIDLSLPEHVFSLFKMNVVCTIQAVSQFNVTCVFIIQDECCMYYTGSKSIQRNFL